MMKMDFESAAIDDLLRRPRDRNPGTARCHQYDFPIGAALQKLDVAVMGEDFWPQLQACGCFEDCDLRCLHNDGVDFVHGNDGQRQMETRLAQRCCATSAEQ